MIRTGALHIALSAVLSSTCLTWAASVIPFPSSVEIETGDSWRYSGLRYRLYGVQACLRGTLFDDPKGERADCGAVSMASLAALLATGTVSCQPVGQARDDATFVVCAATIGETNVDVGTALISSGAAFAAVLPSGEPVSNGYLVAEMTAKVAAAGLWRGQFEHPATLLLGRR